MSENQEEQTGKTDEVDELLKMGDTQLRSMLKAANDTIIQRDKEIADLKIANAKLKDRAESEVKSALIDDIRKVSTYGIEYLSTCAVDRLEQILEDSKMQKRQIFSSSGDLGGGVDPHEKLHTMFKFGKRSD